MLEIIFEFVGGPNDGKIVEGALGESSDAERYYSTAYCEATLNRWPTVPWFVARSLAREQPKDEPSHHFQRHYYVVTDRLEDGDQVWVRTQYDPEAGEGQIQ